MGILHFQVVDAPDTSLNKTSALVTGPHQAMLIDAGLTRSDGHRLVQAVRNMDKTLTKVFISHGDPDFYFGSEVIQDAFPDAQFFAAPQVVEHIKNSFEDKLGVWAHLGDELPARPVLPEPLTGDSFEFSGRCFELRGGHPELPDRQYLWQEHHRAILGGVLLFEGLHVWTADTPDPDQRAAWIELLDDIAALSPAFVVPGHRRAGGPTDARSIRYTREYLQAFQTEIARAPDAATAKAALERRYPGVGLTMAVDIGTKVAKGEMGGLIRPCNNRSTAGPG